MLWIGLTGGIATGKSTVALRLRSKGFAVIDADVIAKEVVASGTPGLKKIVDVFGRSVLGPQGELDRSRMANDIFSDLTKRKQLEAIVHPLVQEKVRLLRQSLELKGCGLAFYDVPLLYEKNLTEQFDAVVVVACSAQKQMERLMARNGIDRMAASARIGSQIPILEKVSLANFVIWNDGSLEDLEADIDRFLQKLDLLKKP